LLKKKNSRQSHKQMELFHTAPSKLSNQHMDNMGFQTFRIEKISMSSTPMSFDLAVEVLSKAFTK